MLEKSQQKIALQNLILVNMSAMSAHPCFIINLHDFIEALRTNGSRIRQPAAIYGICFGLFCHRTLMLPQVVVTLPKEATAIGIPSPSSLT